MDNSKKYTELLDFDRGDKWIEEACISGTEVMVKYQEVFAHLSADFLITEHSEMMLIVTLPGVVHLMGEYSRLFFQLGYLKGLIAGEMRGRRDLKLEELLDKGTE